MKTVIITGANSGLGFECARNILLTGTEYFVVMACRNPDKAQAAKTALMNETGNNNVEVMGLDLSSLQSVRDFAKNFMNSSLPPLYGIVCNAGIAGTHIGQTVDGYELIFGTNHLGHFLLTALLIPNVMDNGRIVIVSSDMHNPPGGISYPGANILADPENGLSNRYPLSKLCNLYFAYELSRKLEHMQKPITVNTFNPGLLTETNLSAGHKDRFTEEFLERVKDLIGSLPVSSEALAGMVTDPHFGTVTATYNDRGTIKPSSELSYHVQNQTDLWTTSVILSGLADEDTFPELKR
ncbi:glucose dehydrogenase [Paenibacillus pectinilyticus]|uniref:Glucose dehydrogenase n=1 Tax=Paenibacillus pectinilyticus TaxID=512399 RepID=A0A1C1A755_9BACL|nr:SDR family NAD(P)-dependent oxidoreductase [Paenibacillus pectinilyticus]OCT16395.1 glucose dehydrogenase [Paenibacillus pectinilyticus]